MRGVDESGDGVGDYIVVAVDEIDIVACGELEQLVSHACYAAVCGVAAQRHPPFRILCHDVVEPVDGIVCGAVVHEDIFYVGIALAEQRAGAPLYIARRIIDGHKNRHPHGIIYLRLHSSRRHHRREPTMEHTSRWKR